MKKEKTLFIGISYRFGSKFQEQCAVESLGAMLYAWMKHLSGTHKENKVEMTFTPDGVITIFDRAQQAKEEAEKIQEFMKSSVQVPEKDCTKEKK